MARSIIILSLFSIVFGSYVNASNPSTQCPWTFGDEALTIVPSEDFVQNCTSELHRHIDSKSNFREEGVFIYLLGECNNPTNKSNFEKVDLDILFEDSIIINGIHIEDVCSNNTLDIKLPQHINGDIYVNKISTPQLYLADLEVNNLIIKDSIIDTIEISASKIEKNIDISEVSGYFDELDLSIKRTKVKGDLSILGNDFETIEMFRVDVGGDFRIGSDQEFYNRYYLSKAIYGDNFDDDSPYFTRILKIRDTKVDRFIFDDNALKPNLIEEVAISDFDFRRIDFISTDELLLQNADVTNKIKDWRTFMLASNSFPGATDSTNYHSLFSLSSIAEKEGKFRLAADTRVKAEERFDTQVSFTKEPIFWMQRKIGKNVAGYGHTPLKALPIFFFFIAIGTVLTYLSDEKNFKNKIVRSRLKNLTEEISFTRILKIKPISFTDLGNRFWYSLETALPIVSLSEDHRKISHSDWYIDWYFHIHKIFGAILTSIFAVALAV